MKKHIYRVSGLTKKGGMKYWKIDLEADTAQEAKARAKELWYLDDHLFQIAVRNWDGCTIDYNFWTHTKAV